MIQTAPLVSIIVNCYNQGHYLERSVRSVLSQTFVDLECIIVDDGSTDNTRQIAESLMVLDSRVKYYFQKNGGLASARNFGGSKAKGEWIQYLDADDWIHEDKTRVQLEASQNYEGKKVVFYCDYERVSIDADNTILEVQPHVIGHLTQEEFIQRLLTPDFLANSPHPALQQAMLMRKSVVLQHPFQEGLKAMVDRYFALELAVEDVAFVYTPIRGAFYTKHQSNMTNNWVYLKNSYASFYQRIADQHPHLIHLCQKSLAFFVDEAFREKNQAEFKQFVKFVQPPIYLLDSKIKITNSTLLNLAFLIRLLIPTTLIYEQDTPLLQKLIRLLAKPFNSLTSART